MSDSIDRVARIREMLSLPETAPIPGAMYRCNRVRGQDYITIAALELHDNSRWSAIAMSVRFGETRITSENNRFEKNYELHTLPDIVPPKTPDLEACIDLALMEVHA